MVVGSSPRIKHPSFGVARPWLEKKNGPLLAVVYCSERDLIKKKTVVKQPKRGLVNSGECRARASCFDEAYGASSANYLADDLWMMSVGLSH